MTYEYIKHLKKTNHTLKLLNSDNIAMSLSFFYVAFVKKKSITLPHSIILNLLDDYLFSLNSSYENAYTKSAKDYLEDFCSNQNAYLRKYHGNDDEPLYELTTYTQKALEILEDLEKKEFVGSRSKFNIIFDLLEELEFETQLDDEQRISVLKEQKRDIDKQIEAIKNNQSLRFDDSRVKEHYMLLEETARKLKYDFTQIEYNFRDLNNLAMEQIASRDDSKSEVLGSIFEIENNIREQDQGKSFFAFWQLLTDVKRSEKLSQMLENLYNNETIKEFDKNTSLKSLKYELLQSTQKVSQVSSKLIEQLRRFCDDRLWLEHKRVLELCKSIEKTALEIKSEIPNKKDFITIKGQKANIKSVFANTLHEVSQTSEFKGELEEKTTQINLDTFYHQFYIDEEKLKQNIQKILLYKPQCSMEDLHKEFPINKGIAELVSYLSIAKNSQNARVDESKKINLEILDFDGRAKIVSMPQIVFVKNNLER